MAQRSSFFQLQAARVFDTLRQGTSRSAAALHDWLSPVENPFLQKAMRLEARHHKPFYSMLIVAALAVLLCFVIWNAWLWLQLQLESGGLGKWAMRPLRSTEEWLLAVFGTHPIGWFAIAVAWICACGAFWASRARAGFLLRQELIKSTLTQLQQMPIAEERWVWLMSAHPLALGVLLGMLGLPVYMLAVFAGQWNWLDILGLLLVFIWLSHAAPVWTPALWQQNAKGKPQKFTWQQLREWNGQGRAAQQSGDAADVLEHQRRMQRAMSGLGEGTASSEEKSPEKQAGFFGFQNAGARGNWWWSVLVFNFMFQGGRGLFGSWGAITEGWPQEIITLLPGIILTWPLVLSRLLFAPIPFFSFHFPPVLLLAPLWLAFSHQGFLTLAANVSAAETFWTPPRVRLRQNLAWLLATLSLGFLFGYFWPILIESGELARVVRGAPPVPTWALAAGWTLTLVAGAFLGGLQMEASFKRANAGLMDAATAWREALFILGRMAVFCVGMYFLFCWLGGKTGVNSIWVSRLPITLVTVFAISLADFGAAALGTTLPPHARQTWGWFRGVWFHGIAVIALLFIVRGAWLNAPFSFEDAPAVLLSPFVTLFSLLRVGAGAPLAEQPLVWSALAVQMIVGVTCCLLAYRAIFARSVNDTEGSYEVSTADADDLTAPPATGWKKSALQILELLSPLRWLDGVIRAVNNWNDALVNWSSRYGNAVLTYELRRRLRKENWAWQWVSVVAVQAILFLSIARPWQLVATGAQTAMTGAAITSNNFAVWGGAVTVVVLLAMALVGFISILSIARAFDADRANGTLVFLFLTPQTDKEILHGKWLTGWVYTLGLLAPALLWLSFGIFSAVVLGALLQTGILAVCALVALACGLLFVSYLALYCAVVARKPLEGQSRAVLALLLVEGTLATMLFLAALNTQDAFANTPDEIQMGIILSIWAAIHAALAALAWRGAQHAFAQRRYGDIEAEGKGAN